MTLNKLHLERAVDGSLRIPDLPQGFHAGVIARNCNTVNYTMTPEKIRRYERHRVNFSTGCAPDRIFFLNQVHGADILRADAPCNSEAQYCGVGDGLVSSRAGFCLIIRTADCVPVLAIDPVQRCIGAAHSGWRSTELSIAARMVEEMNRLYGSNPADLQLYILPSIGPDSYTVNMDVASRFEGFYKKDEERLLLDLWAKITADLVKTGVREDAIFNSGLCTVEHNDRFFSHRKGDAGRNLNYIYMA